MLLYQLFHQLQPKAKRVKGPTSGHWQGTWVGAKTDPQEEEQQREVVLANRGKRDESGSGHFRSATDSRTDPPSWSCWAMPILPAEIQSRFRPNSEVVCWAQLSGGDLVDRQCGLAEGVEDGSSGRCKVAATWCCRPPSPGEVVIDVRTTQAPAGAGSLLDLPEGGEADTRTSNNGFGRLIRR
ncbi:hypothetical protein SKAU_G00352260 [Synaphobranchus kaupii]|uniref:Uncharacterized protein n=1 Tax=Synaphobranchus kaupii TaxID=118154 RepID=A0A9Q1EKU7_SYNKA|nr:hypothetical protein SKAU_G00352260 [Synaphobranchus kaupii]